jgi:hypothetical protein
MSLSCQVEVCNNNLDFSKIKRDYSNFCDKVDLKFIPTKNDFVKFEIALVSLRFMKNKGKLNLLKKELPVLKDNNIGLIKVCLRNVNTESVNYDDCIYNLTSIDLLNGFYEVPRLVYFPIYVLQSNTFNVKLKNEKDDYLWLTPGPNYFDEENVDYTVSCVFHLRPMSLFDVKLLTLASNNEEDSEKYLRNTALRFSSSVSHFFHQNEDFTLWEVALESVFVSKSLMTVYKTARFLEVTSGDIKFFETYSNKKSLELARFDVQYHLTWPITCFRNKNLVFYSVTKRLLNEVSVSLNFLNGLEVMPLTEELNDDSFSIVVLLFRRKIQF